MLVRLVFHCLEQEYRISLFAAAGVGSQREADVNLLEAFDTGALELDFCRGLYLWVLLERHLGRLLLSRPALPSHSMTTGSFG